MELDFQSLFGLLCSLAETLQLHPSPRIWAYIRGRYWSTKKDDISLKPPSSLGRYVFGSEISYNKAPPRLPGLGC